MTSEDSRRNVRELGTAAGSLFLLVLLLSTAFAEDWPTYQHDNERSGVTPEELK